MSWADLFLGGPLTSAVSDLHSVAEVTAYCDVWPDDVLTLSIGSPVGVHPSPEAGGCVVWLEPVVETIKVLDANRFVTATLPREDLRRADFPLTCARILLRAASADPTVSTPEQLLDAVLRRATSVSSS